MSYLVDWVTCRQTFHHLRGQLPIKDGGLNLSLSSIGDLMTAIDSDNEDDLFYDDNVIKFSVKKGYKQDYASKKRFKFSGSHDTSILILCDGTTVFFSGNPSRFGRFDNVFGHSWDDVIKIINRILKEIDPRLPEFGCYEKDRFKRTNVREFGYETLSNSAEITRIDITRNFETGSEANALAMMDYLSGKTLSRVVSRRTGSTLYWGEKRRRVKAYIKHIEMYDHAKTKHKRTELLMSDIYKYCYESGLVRLELTLDRDTLKERNLRFIENITMGRLIELYEERVSPLVRSPKHKLSRYGFDDVPNPYKGTLLLWARGENPKEFMYIRTFQRHAKYLRENYGFDIAVAHTKQSYKPEIIQLELKPSPMPYWYNLTNDFSKVEDIRRMAWG